MTVSHAQISPAVLSARNFLKLQVPLCYFHKGILINFPALGIYPQQNLQFVFDRHNLVVKCTCLMSSCTRAIICVLIFSSTEGSE